MRQLLIVFTFLAIGAAALPAHAYFTPILPAANEPDLLGPNVDNGREGILDYLYGLDNLVRVSDAQDQIWRSRGIGNATVGARFVAADQVNSRHSFGVYTGQRDFTHLFTTLGSGYNVEGDGVLNVAGTFRFGFEWLGPLTGSWSSWEAENLPGALDHMVTFRVRSGEHAGAYVLAWEQQNPGDSDFNDLVVQIDGVAPVPEASTLLLMGSGLFGLAAWRVRKHRRRDS